MIANPTEKNFVKVTAKLVYTFKKEYERYHDKRYYLTKIKRKGNYIWGLKMFKRARQIEYWKRKRATNGIHGGV